MTVHIPRVLAAIALAVLTVPAASAQTWPEVFNPSQVLNLNLQMAPTDWSIVVNDITNSVWVPAQLWADGETPILVTVRRKSSRAIGPKVGLKVDINDRVDGQKWRGLTKLSLENGADVGVIAEAAAWGLHRLAAPSYGYEAALSAFVTVSVNGNPLGVYLSVEQRDKQMLRNRGLWVKDQTWIYDQGEQNVPEREEGPASGADSPAYDALCFSPFPAAPKTTGKMGSTSGCTAPADDAALSGVLDKWINLNAMLTQGAVDAYSANPDALFSHGKNHHFVDFAESRNIKRMYFPWDLDTVFKSTSSSIYGSTTSGGRKGTTTTVTTSEYQEVILRNPTIRASYNQILLNLLNGPLAVGNVEAMLNGLETAVSTAFALDPYPTGDGSAADQFARLSAWVAARDFDVRKQIEADGPPLPR